jgi:hypothetical protein
MTIGTAQSTLHERAARADCRAFCSGGVVQSVALNYKGTPIGGFGLGITWTRISQYSMPGIGECEGGHIL